MYIKYIFVINNYFPTHTLLLLFFTELTRTSNKILSKRTSIGNLSFHYYEGKIFNISPLSIFAMVIG